MEIQSKYQLDLLVAIIKSYDSITTETIDKSIEDASTIVRADFIKSRDKAVRTMEYFKQELVKLE